MIVYYLIIALVEDIKYQFELLKTWVREKWFKLCGINRNFYCQSDIEGERKCKKQCDHCKEYYKPLETIN